MMEWYQISSYLFTNELRIIGGLALIAGLMKMALSKRAVIISLLGGLLVTFFTIVTLPPVCIAGTEIMILVAITWHLLPGKARMCLFIAFFYEVGAALWEFLISAWMGVLFHSERFLDVQTAEYAAAVWVVRLLMIIAALFLIKEQKKEKKSIRPFSIFALLSFFGVITLSQQTIIPFSDGQLTTWILWAVFLMFSILIFNLNRQREMETEIAKLKEEQAELLERDYQALSKTYSDNAKLYHDLHNHIEAIYSCLKQGEVETAVQYCEDLRAPIREISETVWTGDKAIDYLINSKIALAGQMDIRTEINIEYPHNTNIRSVDLVTILGNLLDNALEAAEIVKIAPPFIRLTIRRINDMLIIKVENSCESAPALEGSGLQTSRSDKSLHGWGLKSALSTAERYDGIVNTSCSNDIFQSVVTLSYHSISVK